MNYGRQALRVLGPAILLALGLMTFTGAGAQGALINTGEWLINDETLKELGVEKETIIVDNEDPDSYILVLNLNIIFKCQIFSGLGYILPLGHGDADIELEACTVSDHKGGEANCEVKDIVAKVLTQVILHGPDGAELPYILFSPLVLADKKVDPLAQIHVSGEACPLPSLTALTGSVVAHLTNPTEDVGSQLVLTNAESLTLFPGHVLRYGAQVSHLFANSLVHMTGKYVGEPWGAL